MTNLSSIIPAVLLALTLSPLAQGEEATKVDGKQLHDATCIQCHASRFGNNGADIYTRPDRRVKSLDGLGKQVRRCRDNLGLTWFDDQVEAVIEHLNTSYYHFDK